MEVNKILKLCATMLQLEDIDEAVSSSEYLSENTNKDLNLLMDSVNLVLNTIATDYIDLVKTKIINNKNRELLFSEISTEPIYKIIKVKNMYGEKVPFKVTSTGILCDKGNLSITYSYFPREYHYNDIISEFGVMLTERIVAMGVASEYLFIRGNADDASIWEDRFKNAMRNVVRTRHEVIMPKRRWW